MHEAKKGQQYYFGMKAHIGVDADSGLVRSVHVTSANERDVANTHALLHGQERRVHADSGYTGVAKREEIANAQADGVHKCLAELVEHKKAQIRARVEHPFHIVKNLFGHKKVSYRGLAKNWARMYSLFALANLVIAKRPLLRPAGVSAP